jgi:DNA polymerase-3 subunit epsilon
MKSKYIVSFDIETTGLDKSKDQIIQISLAKFDSETYEIVEVFDSYVQPVGYYEISEAAFNKHGISPQFLIGKPHLTDIAKDIVNFIGDNDILGYNSCRFDIPFLKTELNKYGYDIDFTCRNCYDSFKEETRRNGNRLEQTFERYVGHSMIEEGLEAHNSLSDIKATIKIFKYQNEKNTVQPEFMVGEDGIFEEKEWNNELRACFTVGKYKQLPIEYVAEKDQNYLKWCVSDKCSFTQSTKQFIKQYIK